MTLLKKSINNVHKKNSKYLLFLQGFVFKNFIFRDIFERARMKYVGYIKNIQKDLEEARRLLEKDAEIKMNQELAYQQLIDERRQLLTK